MRRLCVTAGLLAAKVEAMTVPVDDDLRDQTAANMAEKSSLIIETLDEMDDELTVKLLNMAHDALGELQYAMLLLEHKVEEAPYPKPCVPPTRANKKEPSLSQEQIQYRWGVWDAACARYAATRRLWLSRKR